MGNIKQINIKNRTHYLFNDMINIEDFDSVLLKIGIYNIGYITIKKINDYENIYSVNPLHLMNGTVDEYIEEKNESKCLVFNSADGNKEALKKIERALKWD